MSVTIPEPIYEALVDMADKVCVFCDTRVSGTYCTDCMEYKGIMSIAEWQDYTGEIWED
jgi:hypothetical protein